LKNEHDIFEAIPIAQGMMAPSAFGIASVLSCLFFILEKLRNDGFYI
jgi:hypothetical protein